MHAGGDGGEEAHIVVASGAAGGYINFVSSHYLSRNMEEREQGAYIE
jgi:hypothetical protein